MTALALLAAAACLATPVVTSESGRTIVRAGPFQGDLQPRYDVVAGRFSLRAGGHRVGGGSQKIGWLVYSRRAAGDTMVVTGRRLAGPPQTFTQEFTRAW